jgi:hypothetical protein
MGVSTWQEWAEKEFDQIWESLEPEIREDIERLDYRLQVVWREGRIFKVPEDVLKRKMREKFWALVKELTAG